MDVVHVVEGEILPINEPLPESAPRTGKREIMRELSDHDLDVPPFKRRKRKKPKKTARKARTKEVVTKDWVDVIGEEIRSASTQGLFAIVDTVNEMVKEAVMQATADSYDLAIEENVSLQMKIDEMKTSQKRVSLMNERLYTDYCNLYDGLFLSSFRTTKPQTEEALHEFIKIYLNLKI